MITSYHSYDYGYIFLLVKHFVGLPVQIKIDGKTLFKKDEYHVSLMDLEHLVSFIKVGTDTDSVSEDDLVNDFLDYQSTTDLSQFQPTNIFRYVKRDGVETVITMVDMPNLEGLFEKIRVKYGVDIPTQPTHITLYTLHPEVSIGILSQSELERYSEQVYLPDLKSYGS
jgi:hypothetical protein